MLCNAQRVCSAELGCGTISKITPSGALTTLYNFCANGNCLDTDASPEGPLVPAPNGDLYGAPAAFTVATGSLITATVPAGATSGGIQVVTSYGTLLSHVPFRVTP